MRWNVATMPMVCLLAVASGGACGSIVIEVEFNAVNTVLLDALAPQPDIRGTSGGYWIDQIAADEAWGALTSGKTAPGIGFVDSGIDPTLMQFQKKIEIGGASQVTGIPFAQDTKGHGSMVASAAASRGDDEFGSTGVSWDSPVIVYSVTESPMVADAVVRAGVLTLAKRPDVRIINISMGACLDPKLAALSANVKMAHRDWRQRQRKAVAMAAEQGKLIVLAAGNDGNKVTYCDEPFVSGQL